MEARRSTDGSSSRSSRKKILSTAEKNQIRNFHHSHPLVTHTQIANFFGLERSTVTKIIGQPQPASTAPDASPTPYPQVSSAYTAGPAPPTSSDMAPPEGHMSVEAYNTQSHVTRALTLWAQQKQQQGIRVTQKMIRQEAANLAALHERSFRGPNDSSAPIDTGRGGSPGSSYSRASSATTSSSYGSASGVGGWSQEWSLGSGDYRADNASVPPGSSGVAAPASAGVGSAPYAPGMWPSSTAPSYNSLASSLDVAHPYLSSASTKEAFRTTTERLRSGSNPADALEDLSSFLKADTEGMSSFDFLCLEHLRERVASGRKRSSQGQYTMNWSATAPAGVASTTLR